MKKTLFVLMLVLLSAVLMVSCDNEKDSGPKTISIEYDVNGGALAKDGTYPDSAQTGDEITPTAPTRGDASEDLTNYDDASFVYGSATVTTAYNFKGWKVKGADDSTASPSFTAGREDVTLVAVWDVKKTVSNAKDIKLSSKVSAGKTVTLGKYNDKGIAWTVLAVDSSNKRALLVSGSRIGNEMQHNTTTTSYSWDSSLIKSWLNETGKEGFISQAGLSEVKMATPDSTVGTVFLLSEQEAMTTYSKILDRVLGGKWWLRDGDGTSCKYMEANTVKVSSMDAVSTSGVRPAFWINL